MENKIDLRNKYVLRVLNKVNELEKMTTSLSQIDNALFSQTGGAEATITQVRDGLIDRRAADIAGINATIGEQITLIKTALGDLLAAINAEGPRVDAVTEIANQVIGAAGP